MNLHCFVKPHTFLTLVVLIIISAQPKLACAEDTGNKKGGVYRAGCVLHYLNMGLNRGKFDLVHEHVKSRSGRIVHASSNEKVGRFFDLSNNSEYDTDDVFTDATERRATYSIGSVVDWIIVSDKETVYIMFAGTNWLKNGGLNLVGAFPNAAYDGAVVQPAWAGMAATELNRMMNVLRQHVNERKEIVISGHSMGGAVAGYTTFLLAKVGILHPGKPHYLVTFGAPRYATQSFRTRLNKYLDEKKVGLKAFALEFSEDPVPKLWQGGAIIGNHVVRPLGTIDDTSDGEHGLFSYARLAWAVD